MIVSFRKIADKIKKIIEAKMVYSIMLNDGKYSISLMENSEVEISFDFTITHDLALGSLLNLPDNFWEKLILLKLGEFVLHTRHFINNFLKIVENSDYFYFCIRLNKSNSVEIEYRLNRDKDNLIRFEFIPEMKEYITLSGNHLLYCAIMLINQRYRARDNS